MGQLARLFEGQPIGVGTGLCRVFGQCFPWRVVVRHAGPEIVWLHGTKLALNWDLIKLRGYVPQTSG